VIFRLRWPRQLSLHNLRAGPYRFIFHRARRHLRHYRPPSTAATIGGFSLVGSAEHRKLSESRTCGPRSSVRSGCRVRFRISSRSCHGTRRETDRRSAYGTSRVFSRWRQARISFFPPRTGGFGMNNPCHPRRAVEPCVEARGAPGRLGAATPLLASYGNRSGGPIAARNVERRRPATSPRHLLSTRRRTVGPTGKFFPARPHAGDAARRCIRGEKFTAPWPP